jgi:hypothetical protein
MPEEVELKLAPLPSLGEELLADLQGLGVEE